MKFKNLDNGSIYDVTDEALIPSYESNPSFEKVEEKPKKTATKATVIKK